MVQIIESKIINSFQESLVLPNMEDLPFFPSAGTGGIFDFHEQEFPEEDQSTDFEMETSENEIERELTESNFNTIETNTNNNTLLLLTEKNNNLF